LFIYIGIQDPVVRIEWGNLTQQSMKLMGFKKYAFKAYDGMVHSSSDEVIKIVL